MDDDARSAARRRAWIAFGLAGVLLVVNVVAAFAWREERRDRLDGARIEIERRLDERFRDSPWERGDGRGADGDRPHRGPFSPGGPGSGRGSADLDGERGQDGGPEDGGPEDGADGQGGTA